MSAFRFALLGSLVMVIGVASAREEKSKIDKDKLVGTWTLVKTDSVKDLPKDFELTVEFTKDGKVNTTTTVAGKTRKETATYAVKGDRMTTVRMDADGKDKKEKVVTIAVLTDKKLVTSAEEGGKTVTNEFKK
jgi:uncharacterized protein (TIGR03066 family)